MKRLIPLLLTLALGASLPALDTPLVLRVQGTPNADMTQTLVVNPANGSLTLYQADTQELKAIASTGFLLDLEVLDKVGVEQKGVMYSYLRMGSARALQGLDWTVNSETLLGQLPNKKQGDKPSQQEAARAAENAWWEKEHAYDGVVRAAWNGEYLFLCIPSKHVVMIYQADANGIKRLAWQNYGPLLLLPGGYKTSPPVSEVLSRLPPLQKKQLEEEAKKALEEGGDQVAATPASDVWVGAGRDSTFFVVDLANSRVMTFGVTPKACTIKAVRNIAFELKLPARQNFRSTPDADDTLKEYVQSKKKELQAAGLDQFVSGEDAEYKVRALVQSLATKQAGGKSAGFQANSLDDKIVLDFTDRRKLITYGIATEQLELLSVRDYTADLAVSALDEMIKKKAAAAQLLQSAEKGMKQHAFALRTLKFALQLDPTLIAAIEKNTRLVNELKKEEEAWGPLLDEGHKALEAYETKLKGIAEMAKKMKEDDAELLKEPKKEDGK